jgi:hypothetical protein
MRHEISKALLAVTKDLYQEEERRRKDAARTARQSRDWYRPPRETTLKEAVFAVLPQALAKATGSGAYPVSARTLYYQVRPLIQQYTDKPLEYDYFSQTLLTQYRDDYGPITGLYYDPRGVLYEPHTGQEVKLGTREVEAYRFPAWLYNKILYVEKKGLWPILSASCLAERFDMAVIAAEGYASEAARVLFEHADKNQGYQLFVLHDADPYGYNIARTLREETRRMPGYKVDVLELGLQLEDALKLGLGAEEFTRKKALPAGLKLTETEKEYFVGKPSGYGRYTSWVCRRIELNAFTAPALVAYIEQRLAATGAIGKVIPPDERLPSLAEVLYQVVVKTAVEASIARLLESSDLYRRIADEFRDKMDLSGARKWIEAAFRRDSSLPWTSAVDDRLRKSLAENEDEMEAVIREWLQRIAGGA